MPPPTCPHLPDPPEAMDWRALNELGDDRGDRFYLRCLQYGHYLWQRGLAARALLAVDRALLADLAGEAAVLKTHPLPYRAIVWVIHNTPADVFIGNPRVHYQHLADRVREPRRKQRSARAWACWHLVRRLQADLSGDPRHEVVEPTESETRAALATFGIAREVEWWAEALEMASRLARTPLRER